MKNYEYKSPYSPEFSEFKHLSYDTLKDMSKEDLLEYINEIHSRWMSADIGKNQAVRDVKMYRNELKVYMKALALFVNWAEECDFGYDQIPDEYEKYKDVIERNNTGYCEGLIYIAKEEAREAVFRRKDKV